MRGDTSNIGRLTIRALIACLISSSATEGLRSLAICEGSLIESVGRQCPHSFGANRFFFSSFCCWKYHRGTKSSSLFLLTLDFGFLCVPRVLMYETRFFFGFRDIPVGLCTCVCVCVVGLSLADKAEPLLCWSGQLYCGLGQSTTTTISNNRKNTLKLPYMLL